jgi:arsenite-transporting ATPase
VGSAGLPLTVVDGVTVATGSYPTKSALLALAGLEGSAAMPLQRIDLGLTEKAASGCRGGTGCC